MTDEVQVREEPVSESKALDAFHEAEERFHEARRRFFKLAGFGAAAAGASALGWPRDVFAAPPDAAALKGGGATSPFEREFILAKQTLYMNIGTTGSTPREVLKNLNENARAIARDPRLTFNAQTLRNTIAAGFGADPNEIVMSFNTTDGMSKIMAGLALPPGSEIITTNMEHPGGNGPMQIARDRHDLVLKRINLPTNDYMSDANVLARFASALTPSTRAIVFSSPPYLTGVRLNEKQLCGWAASQGLISIIDGAHTVGMINLNFHDIGVDFFAGSGHKWQCGPGQTGIMYVRNGFTPGAYTKSVSVFNGLSTDTIDNVVINIPGYSNTTPLHTFFPTISSQYSGVAGTTLAHGDRSPDHNVAAMLMAIGNPSYPSLKALQEVCSMWDAWGRQTIEDYIVTLAQYLRARLVSIWGPRCLSAAFSSSTPHYARTGLTGFNPFSPGFDFNAVLSVAEAAEQTIVSGNAVTALREEHGIVVRNTNCPHSLRGNPAMNADATTPGAMTSSHALRISTHLFHTGRDVDRLIRALLKVVPHP